MNIVENVNFIYNSETEYVALENNAIIFANLIKYRRHGAKTKIFHISGENGIQIRWFVCLKPDLKDSQNISD